MKRYKKPILTTALLLASALIAPTFGQEAESFTLEQCIAYAVEHNNSIKVQQYDNLTSERERSQAVASLFPSLSANSSITNSYGRSIDPETNTYTTRGNLSNSYGISAYLTLFDGLAGINAVKASRVRVEMGQHQLQQLKDEKALSAMNLFYEALYLEQSVAITSQQLAASQRVLQLTQKQLELGIKSEADVAQAMAQVANDDLLLTQQQGNYAMALLNLKEAMNFPLEGAIALVQSLEVSLEHSIPTQPLVHNPKVLAARSNLDHSRIELNIAKGSYLPTLEVGAGYNTNYFTLLDSPTAQRLFAQQLKDNYGYYVGATLSIPLFQGLRRHTQVVRSRHNLKVAELQLSQTELRVEKAVQDALLQRANSLKEQLSAAQKVSANSLANRAMTQKYEQGIVSIIDLQKSSNDLLQAKAEELRARFNYLIHCKMVGYYINGKY